MMNLEDETSTDTRIGQTADLARAVLRVSLVEAKAAFRVGLSLADSFSADDMEETLGLLAVGRHYKGDPISPRTVYGFSRICEVQMPDEADRYDWERYSDAFARLGGLQLFPLLTCLRNRGRGGIEDAHLESLAKLTQTGRLDADLAAGMIGLFQYADMLRFRLPTFVEHLLPSLSQTAAAALFAFAETELDRVDGATPPNSLILDLLALAHTKLPAENPSRRRLAALAQPENKPDPSYPGSAFSDANRDPFIIALLGETARFAADALDAIVVALPGHGNGRPIVQLLWAVADRQSLPDDRLDFLEAVIEARAIPLDDKLIALTDILKTWAEGSAALRAAVPDMVVRLTRRHAQDLIHGEWNGGYSRRRLRELAAGAVPETRLVTEILQRLGGQTAVVSSSAWFDFAEVLARVAQATTIADCLTRYVEKSEIGLPDAIAGGLWQPGNAVPATQVEAVACLLWTLLGAPDSSTRWRAAHAVRRLVSLGRADVLGHLVANIDSTSAGAFQDSASPFLFLNAKLWLLITLARIAIDDPALVAPFQPQLEAIAHSTELPHVLIREMAARTLVSVAASLPPGEAATLRARSVAVNASPWPMSKVERRGGTAGFYDRRPDGYPERDLTFRFEYEFEKHEVTALASLFGTHKYEAGDRIADWVRVWAPNAISMWDDYRGGEGGGSRPQTMETHIGTLTWHGVFLAAGSLLLTHPISSRSWTADAPWAEWLADGLISRDDGRWLADDTSLTPIEMRTALTVGEEPVPRLSRSLVRLFTDGADAGFLVVEGSWETMDGVEISISSAFVPRAKADTVALTVALADQHDVWIPRADELDSHSRNEAPWRSWLIRDEATREGGLDKDDPYASNAARCRIRPIDAMVRSGNLQPDPPFNRCWRTRGGKLLANGIVWGMRFARGQHEKVREGRRLTAELTWIRDLCRHRNQCLVMVVQARRYMPKMSGDAAFPSRWLVATVDRDGIVRPVFRIPAATRKAVAELGLDRRREFKDRFDAVAGALVTARRPAR
ncbi:hypothetical protein, partial [Devosia sp.]|uniref:hypothetical protein n=1 Tax=Devosia sp. TaxID=1871048 RepID=UPI002619D54D